MYAMGQAPLLQIFYFFWQALKRSTFCYNITTAMLYKTIPNFQAAYQGKACRAPTIQRMCLAKYN